MRNATLAVPRSISDLLLCGALAIAPMFLPGVAHAAVTEKLLHSFGPEPDGLLPNSGVIRGPDGTLYGTAAGGKNDFGVVYKITPDGKEVILHSFKSTGGQAPFREPVLDLEGNLYGTTSESYTGKITQGQVFKITPDGRYSVLHTFEGPDGASPGGVTVDAKGNIYGVAPAWGPNDHGVLYEITSRGEFKLLHAFTGDDGAAPSAAPLLDGDGNIFGTTIYGGANDAGTIYEVTPDGKETVLHSFSPQTDGYAPIAGLARDDNGNLYGGGALGGVNQYGTLFKLTPSGRFTVLHAFGAGDDGWRVDSTPTLVKNDAGKLEIFGLTAFGGAYTEGTAYKYWGKGHYKILYNFTGSAGRDSPPDGGGCLGLLATDFNGNFYGACGGGGSSNLGAVFEIQTH